MIRSRCLVSVLSVGAFALLSVVGCDENKESHYASFERAASDHEFERGGLPEELRQGPTSISEFTIWTLTEVARVSISPRL